MALLLEVTHRTLLTYSAPVSETVMELRLRPRDGDGQRVLSFDLAVSPRSPIRSFVDAFGNTVHYFNHVPAHERVEVQATSLVATSGNGAVPGLDFAEDFLNFRSPVLDVAGVRHLADRVRDGASTGTLDALAELINKRFTYRPEITTVYTAVDEVLRLRQGVCQDFAHLFIACARSLGIPARYVSGYIHSGRGHVGSGESHAWAEAWVPGVGWVGYDPTNPIRAGERHVKVAVGRDYHDVPPSKGTFVGSAQESLKIKVATSIVRDAAGTG